jgi:hypothetical protein
MGGYGISKFLIYMVAMTTIQNDLLKTTVMKSARNKPDKCGLVEIKESG